MTHIDVMALLEDPAVRSAIWWSYLLAAVMLPLYHLNPILRYSRGHSGIGDACLRTETLQCAWRIPALLFSALVAPSLPLFLSIALDMAGRIGRILAMRASHRRWLLATATVAADEDQPAPRRASAVVLQIRRRVPSATAAWPFPAGAARSGPTR